MTAVTNINPTGLCSGRNMYLNSFSAIGNIIDNNDVFNIMSGSIVPKISSDFLSILHSSQIINPISICEIQSGIFLNSFRFR